MTDVHAWISDHVDLGDLPTWLAFFGAAAAARYTLKTLRIEQGRERAREAAERRAQAVQVSAWAELGPRRPMGPGLGVKVVNISDQPVTRVRLEVQVEEATWTVARFLVLPPRAEQYHEMPEHVREEVRPLITEAPSTKLRNRWTGIYRDLPVTVKFVDAAGRTWVREPSQLWELRAADDPDLFVGDPPVPEPPDW